MNQLFSIDRVQQPHSPRRRRWGSALAATLLCVPAAAPASAAGPRETAAAAPSAAAAAAAAKRSGHRVEITGQAGELRKVYAKPDGTFTAHLFSEPVQVRRDGHWLPVDTTLVARSDGTVGPRTAAASMALSGGGAEHALARLRAGGDAVELTWPGALPRPRLSGDTAIYPEVRPGIDLKVRVTAQGFAPLLVVKSRRAAGLVRTIRWGRRITGSAIRTGRPGMWEAATGLTLAAPRTGVRRGRITARATPGRLTLEPDAQFMADSATVYPLAIAPPDYARAIWESGWVKVMSGNADSAFWLGGTDDGWAKVGYCGWPYCNGIGRLRSYFQYDHQGFLFGKNILRAELNAHEVYAPSCSARWVDLWHTEPIGPGTTWNNQPWATRSLVGSYNVAHGYSAACPENWLGFDVTGSVRARVAQGRGVFTYALAAGDENDAYGWKKFESNPSLIVHYNTPPAVPSSLSGDGRGCGLDPNEPRTPQAAPELSATVSDPDGGLVAAEFEWFTRFGSRLGSAITAEKRSGERFSVVLPALADGTKLGWRVRAWDGRDWSPFSGWCDLTVDLTHPQEPTVTSTDYPDDNQWHGGPGVTGTFTFEPNPIDRDVAGFKYSLTNDQPDTYVAAPSGRVTVPITPGTGTQHLRVVAVDRAGNPGPRTVYDFNVGLDVPPAAGRWKLDGVVTDTTAPDATGNGRTGTLVSAGWTTGRIGDAVRLNGTSGHVSTAGGPPVRTDESFSVAAWVRLDAAPAWHAAVSIDGNRAPAMYLQWSQPLGGWAFGMPVADADGTFSHRSLMPDAQPLGKWTHLAGVYDDGAKQLRLYVNGVAAPPIAHDSAWRAAGALQIGRAKWNGAPVDFWRGAVDEVEIHQRVLSPAEIRRLAGRPIEETRWMFDEGAGTRADDATGDYRPATLTGGAGWTASPFGTALQLDGTGSAATDAPAVRTDNAFTVSAWVYAGPGSLGQSSRTAVSQDGDRRSGFRLGYEGAHGWAFEVPRGPADRAGAARAVAPEPPIPEEWTHLAGVFDPAGGQLLLYVNGVASATAQLDTGWVPWHAAGPLQIGRAKVAGLPAGYWSGAVDDVRVFAGVRAQDEIEQDVVNPSGPPVTPYTGSFGRFVNHDGDHMTTTGPPPRGYRFERPLGMPAPDGAAGTRMLYACKLAADMFTSAQADCEGNPKVAAIGRVYASPPADVLTRALYRCKVTSNGEHFESHLDTCEGQSTEGLLGYVRAYAPLVSHLQTDPPNDRRTSIGLVPASYWAERSFGYVALAGGSGERMLYGCQDGDDAFSSRDSACEGKQVLGGNGYVWTAPPPDQDSAGLYRCRAAATGRRYDSLLESCGGDTVDTLLGYVVTAP